MKSLLSVLFSFLVLTKIVFPQTTYFWQMQNSGSYNPFNSVYFVNDQIGWAGGGYGDLRKTTDGGNTWQSQELSFSGSISSINFNTDQVGWIVGVNGTIMKTTNGGTTWTAQTSGTSSTFQEAWFIQNTGWAVGDAGTIVKTTDGGATWTAKSSGTTSTLWFVRFVNANTGWVVVDGGGIRKTTDGGTTWTAQNTGVTGTTLWGLSFVDENNGWAIGDYGTIISTVDGGAHWVAQNSGTYEKLRAVYFVSSQTGWVVGKDGIILNTTDGGHTWAVENPGVNDYELYAMHFANPTAGWAVGTSGTVLKYTGGNSSSYLNLISPNGGETWAVGSQHNIIWSSYSVQGIKIQYTTDNGTTWNVIQNAVPASGNNYLWTVPNTPSSQCKVQISDTANSATSDISNNIFTIDNSTLITWSGNLSIADAGNLKSNGILTFGQAPRATDGIDALLGEADIPPVPPAGIFDIRFLLPGTPSFASLKDFRNDTLSQVVWNFSFQAGASGYPFTIKWNPAALPSGKFALKDVVTGTIINVNMKTDSTLTVTNTGISQLKIEYTKQVCANVSLNNGWNMISVPVVATSMAVADLFPAATSPAYGYNGAYVTSTVLANGQGYWLRYGSSQVLNICGSSVAQNTIPVTMGWNIIGLYDKDALVDALTTTPSGILASPFYGYQDGYTQASTLKIGKGFWIKVSQNGTINLPTSVIKAGNPEIVTGTPQQYSNKLVVIDHTGKSGTLYLVDQGTDLSHYVLPPLPPQGIFDVRFDNNSLVENCTSKGATLLLSGLEYPVTIKNEGPSLRLMNPAHSSEIGLTLGNGKELSISDNSVERLRILNNTVPAQYDLSQNYPNPFNPSTTIKYALQFDSQVKLVIYNAIGQRVQELVYSQQSAGTYEQLIQAQSLSSGIYFYELTAKSLQSGQVYRAVKKMSLLK